MSARTRLVVLPLDAMKLDGMHALHACGIHSRLSRRAAFGKAASISGEYHLPAVVMCVSTLTNFKIWWLMSAR